MDEEWREAMVKLFKVIELRVRYWLIFLTPAEEIKRAALDKVEKELKELKED